MISVIVDTSEELGARTASALLGHPLVDHVALIDRDPPASWRPRARRADSTDGYGIGVGVDVDGIRVFRREGLPGGAGWASPIGLATALAHRLANPGPGAATIPGRPLSVGERFAFPPPVGWAYGKPGELGIHECPIEGTTAAVLATATEGPSIACVDDNLFLTTACLAAGVIVAGTTELAEPVFHHPELFLEACEIFGLVFAVADQPD
jgi:hypothetical protein